MSSWHFTLIKKTFKIITIHSSNLCVYNIVPFKNINLNVSLWLMKLFRDYNSWEINSITLKCGKLFVFNSVDWGNSNKSPLWINKNEKKTWCRIEKNKYVFRFCLDYRVVLWNVQVKRTILNTIIQIQQNLFPSEKVCVFLMFCCYVSALFQKPSNSINSSK